jgi:sulfonate transport system permease protein
MLNRRPLTTNAGAILFAALMIALWQYAVDQRILSPIFVAAPSNIALALIRLSASGELWDAFRATLMRMLAGWLSAAIAGIGIGAMVGLSPRLDTYLRPTLEFFRQLPAAVIIPPAILLLGLSEQMMALVVGFGVTWPILLATLHGFTSIDPCLREVAAALEMSASAYFRKIALPAAMPDILAGIRISLAIALILAVVVEMQAGYPGMGRFILLAQRGFRAPDLYAGIAILGAFGFLINLVAAAGERHVLRWRTPQR